MNDKPFLINNEFYIDPTLGLVISQITDIETRLEPRLMHLLCLLAASPGKLVGRELLTREVWDDYGSADEGLTQAVSYLRRILNDDSKELIETVPKKGYVLNAEIKTGLPERKTKKPLKPNKKKAYWFIALLVLLVILSAYFLRNINHKGNSTQEKVIIGDKLVDSNNNKPSDGLMKEQKTKNPDKVPDTSKSSLPSSDSKK